MDEDAEPVEKAILPVTMESLRFWLRVMEKSWPRVGLYQLSGYTEIILVDAPCPVQFWSAKRLPWSVVTRARAPRHRSGRAGGSSSATTAQGASVTKCPSPLDVRKDTSDHSCYGAREDE